jgi:hypothetical protein
MSTRYWFSMLGKYNSKLFTNNLTSVNWIKPSESIRLKAEPYQSYDVLCSDCGDKNCHWWNTSKPENYPDAEISYHFNNYAYRCDDFNKKEATNNFLFAGCSNTQGTGLPYESTWAFQLNKYLGKTKFFSVAVSGCGYEQNIYDIYAYIDTFGKPEAIFMMAPNLERDITFITYQEEWNLNFDHWNNGAGNEAKQKVMRSDVLCLKFYRQMLHLEQFCKALNIPFLWTTWFQNLDEIIVNNMEFNNYFSLYSRESAKITIDSGKVQRAPEGWSVKYWENGRDIHAGASRQFAWHNIFKHYWKERYENSNTSG